MLIATATTTAMTTPAHPKPVAYPMRPPSSPSTTITTPISNQLLRRLRSISRKKVVGAADSVIGQASPPGGSGFEAEVDLWDGGVLLRDLEVVAPAEAEDPGQQRVGEGLNRGVVLPDRAVVMLPGETDLVLGGGQLLMELHDILVGLELRVVLHEGEELTQGSGQEILCLGRLRGAGRSLLLSSDGGIAGLDDASERRLLELHVALHGVDQVGDQVMPPLELNADLVPGLVDHVPQADEPVVHEDQEERDDRDDDQDDPERGHRRVTP